MSSKIAMRSSSALLFVICFQMLFLAIPTVSFSVNTLSSIHRRRLGDTTAPSTTLYAEKTSKKAKEFTLKDLREELMKNPDSFRAEPKKKYRRTRKRVENPKQDYVYAAQRKQQKQRDGDKEKPITDDKNNENNEENGGKQRGDQYRPTTLAKQYGISNPASQHCDAVIDDVEPVILGKIRVGGDNDNEAGNTGSYAYVISKPAGWAILGGGGGKNKKGSVAKKHPSPKKTDRIALEIRENDGSVDVLEYTEEDVMALLTPEELEEYLEEKQQQRGMTQTVAKGHSRKTVEEDVSEDELEYNQIDFLSQLTPEERAEYEAEMGTGVPDSNNSDHESPLHLSSEASSSDATSEAVISPEREARLARIEARRTASKDDRHVSFAVPQRPSVVGWLKEFMSSKGTPIRGGKAWKAIAGATAVDDSGIVLLCPKDKTDSVFVDYMEYVAVVGNGGYLAKTTKSNILSKPTIYSKLRRGRGDDVVQTVKLLVEEQFSTCNDIVDKCQRQFQDGIRGDPAANPFDRRAPRRLIHCQAISVSSLAFDETVETEVETLPDDIAILAERRNLHEFQGQSFLGRSSLATNPQTTAYREINGAADGFPGWVVDRYDKWLLVQHDERMPRGPLPSIHDGNTVGVYYLPADPNRSAMGSELDIRPRLLEGQPAPDLFPILENGVSYLVSLDRDLSTGIFLDQRPQRAWLTRNCNKDTKLLNLFAHCGAFSIAAASAGASTTSIDLNKKWLERVQPQLQANGVDFDIRHDCIYGDCFEWLAKLAKRGEKYDIVVVDPPSSSVGNKKKRWSVKRDMNELVALAAQVVKPGGLLWTTTNCASMSPISFANQCWKGLEEAGLDKAKLERIQPMPEDFATIGSQPVKNLVWRIPRN